MVGVTRKAGDHTGVTGLYRAGGPAQTDHTAGPAHRDMVKPARAHAQVLGQTNGGIGHQRETGHAHAVDIVFVDP